MTYQPVVPPWRLTRTLMISGGLVGLAAIWFSIGLLIRTPSIIGWMPLLVAVPIAAVTSWRAADHGRGMWRWSSGGIVLIGLGAAANAYDYFSGNQQGQHISGWTSGIYISGLALFMWGLLRIPGIYRSRIEWIRFGLDNATMIVTVLTFAWHLIYPRWHGWLGDSVGGAITVLIVVGAGFICVFAFIKVAFTGTGPIDRRALHLLALTGAVGAGGGALAPLLESRPYLNTAHVLLPSTCFCLCIAADRQLRATRAGMPPPRVIIRKLSLTPYAAVLATGGLLLFSALTHTDDLVAIAIGSVTVTLLVAARQLVALRDNLLLLDDLDHRATHDVLTGLPNRTVLAAEIDAALAAESAGIRAAVAATRTSAGTSAADSAGSKAGPVGGSAETGAGLTGGSAEAGAAHPARVSAALVDLDDFKEINDDLGHAVGDALLIAVAERIAAQLPPDAVVARLGGDEYALLLRSGDHAAILAAIAAQLRLPVHAAGHELVIEASFGLAPARPGDTADELLRRADVAMYEAKGQGKGRQVGYTAEMDQRTAEQSRLAADLRMALDTDQLYLLYQPIVSMPGGELFGVEALVRWKHPDRGPVSPVTFIPAAERTGLIVPLGAWILEEACRQGAAWLYELGDASPKTVTVNVSARQLRESGFAGVVDAVLQRTGLPPHVLTVEITETAVFDGGAALTELQAIAALGVNIALDDFGTGHSSLSLLRTCPADILKVDKSFVDDITEGGQHAVVTAALIQICDGLHLRAVAEGVETAAQAAELHRLGYRFAQGYHYARPLPPAEIPAYRPPLPVPDQPDSLVRP